MKQTGNCRTCLKIICIVQVIALVLVLPAFPKPAEAVTQAKLCGYVTDVEGKPIEGCYIDVSNANYMNLGNTYTNEKGYYELNVPKERTYWVWAGKTAPYNFVYIPQSKAATLGPVDFKLLPAANIVIKAYDGQGNLLKNRQFREITNSRVFVTDMTNMPAPGYFGAVHNEESNWDWNLAIPALAVLPQRQYKIHVEMEVPGLGKMMLSADNGGKGYSLDKQGEQIVINLNYEVAKTALAMLRAQDDGTFAKETNASAHHLAVAERYLNQHSPDMEKAIAELNLSLKYSTQAREQIALAKAQSDIEKYRKGNIQLRVVDAAGKPIKNCQVNFHQVSHDFLFGANPMGISGSYDKNVASLMKDAGVNLSYVTVRWGLIQPEPAKFDWQNIDSYQQINQQLADGFKLMGALSLWFSQNGDFTPEYLKNISLEQLESHVYNYAYSLANRYKGKIDVWEINEMNLASANALGLATEQKIELMHVFADAIKKANPEAKILNGSTALPYEFTDSLPFPTLLKSGVPVDIIGLELYYSGVNAEGYPVVGLDLATISELLDYYASFGKPIYVKELSAPSVQIPGSSWWHRPWDTKTQAEYLEKIYTIAFSKPLIKAIAWSWGVSDIDAFIVGGGLLDAKLIPKPAYFALKNLIRSWTTVGSGITNEDGEYSFRGFGGHYSITLTTPNGHSVTTTVHVTEQKSDVVIIQVK